LSGGVALVLLAALSISLTNVSAPFVYEAGGNPQTIIILRNLAFLLLCGLWLKTSGRFRWLERRGQLVCFGAGIAYTCGAAGLLLSLLTLPVSLAILIFFTFPLMTALLESTLDRRLPGLGQVVCLLACLVGLGIALEVERFALAPEGVIFASIGAVGVAISYVWTGRVLPGVDSAVMTFHMAITGLIGASLYVAATGSFALPAGGGPGFGGWAALAVAVLGFAVAFFAMFRGVHLIGPAPTAMVMNLEPVFTIALAVTLLAETLSDRKLIGAAVVLGAVVASQLLLKRRRVIPPV
jgi:drug/metabolite transporter (DMT)-like permease